MIAGAELPQSGGVIRDAEGRHRFMEGSTNFFVGLRPFRSIRTIAWERDLGQRVPVILGKMDVVRVKPNQSRGDPQCTRQSVRTPPVSGGQWPPASGGGVTRSASYPVDDVHLCRIT